MPKPFQRAIGGTLLKLQEPTVRPRFPVGGTRRQEIGGQPKQQQLRITGNKWFVAIYRIKQMISCSNSDLYYCKITTTRPQEMTIPTRLAYTDR